MLIHRCAWHRKTFGYVAYLRVTRDGRWRVDRSDGICRACRDVMLATARGQAPKSVSIKRELARAALALTAVAAYALLILLAGCSDVAEPYRTSSGAWQVSARVFSEDLCGAAPSPTPSGIGKLVLFVEPATLDKIDAECRAGRYQTPEPLKPLGRREAISGPYGCAFSTAGPWWPRRADGMCHADDGLPTGVTGGPLRAWR